MDTAKLWESVLSELKKQVSTGEFLMYLQRTHLASLEDTTAVIYVPSAIHSREIQKRYKMLIKTKLEELAGRELVLQFQVKDAPKQDVTLPTEGLFAEATERPAAHSKPLSIGHPPRVKPDFTFSNFAVSSSNQLAFVSAQTVAKNLGKMYNPLYIYGPVGVGKTHLMHAIANDAYQKQPNNKILYITSEEFTNDVIEAIKTNTTGQMKKRFRSVSILLIDDIQFVGGKKTVQEELFHTFNELVNKDAQIVFSSDRPPHEIQGLEERLSSRFAGGLTVDVGPPDTELKMAILGIKSAKLGLMLPNDVALFIAENAQNTRSLEGLLHRVLSQATMSGQDITLELAEKALGVIQEERRGHLHADDVIKTICEFYGFKPTQLKGQKRDAALVRARQIAMYLLKTELGMTYVEIGNILGGRDHTTIMHGVEKITSLVENKAKLSEDISGITTKLRG